MTVLTVLTREPPLNADQNLIAYRAKWICPVDQEPIEDGAVVVRGNRVVTVGRFHSIGGEADKIVDLGVGAIIPGLVNAHTHLEFSDLEQPLGHPGIGFTDWIRLVVSSRSESSTRPGKSETIRAGLDEAFRSGTWVVGEIATEPVTLDAYQISNGPSLLVFLEQLGSNPSKFHDQQKQLSQFVESESQFRKVSNVRCGISPHAPYSVHPALLKQMCALAMDQQKPVAMHVAETRDELELIEDRRGHFVELLQGFGVWDPNPTETYQSILQILEQLSQAPRSLVVHGNYLKTSELEFIADHRAQMSVVFCPRTHQFFQHDPYPLTSLRRHKINVALGTDSRASNPDLDLFAESKLVARNFAGL